MASGVSVNEDCIKAFNELRLQKKSKFIIFELNKTNTEIVIRHQEPSDKAKSNEDSYTEFLGHLEPQRCSYAVFDFEYDTSEGRRNRIVFVYWAPDECKIKEKMVYSSSKEALKRALQGVQVDIQGTDDSEIAFEEVLAKCSKR